MWIMTSCWAIYHYCDMSLEIVLDVGYGIWWYDISVAFSLCLRLNYFCLNSPDCSAWSNTCLYPLSHYIHITDDYWSKMSMCWYFIVPKKLSHYWYQGIWCRACATPLLFYTINASSCAGTGHGFVEINCVLQNHPMNVRINFRESGLALCNLSIKIADTNRKQDRGKLADIN